MIASVPGMLVREWWVAKIWRQFWRAWELRMNPRVLEQEAEMDRVQALIDRLLP